MNLTRWDIYLLIGVTLQVALVAYLHHPRAKAIATMLPVPFTLSVLALNRPIDATHMLGAFMLLLFAQLLRFLHVNLRVPIIASILIAVVFNGAAAMLIAPHVPMGNLAFFAATGMTLLMVVGLMYFTPRVPAEPGHRTPLPPYIKIPLIAVFIFCLILLKSWLRGFMTVFPMVTVFAAYESRRSLRTLCAQVPLNVLVLVAMLVACRLTQDSLGLPEALVVAWAAFLAIFGVTVYLASRPVASESTVPVISGEPQ